MPRRRRSARVRADRRGDPRARPERPAAPALSRGLRRRPPDTSLSRACFLAAVKACGTDAVLSHYSAAVPLAPPQVGLPRPRGDRADAPQARQASAPTGARTSSARSTRASRSRPRLRTLIDLSSMLPYKPAAQSGQRSPQPAARQAARTRHRATTEAHSNSEQSRRLRRPHTQRVRGPRPRPPRRPPEAAGQPAAPRLRPRLPLARPPPHPRSRRPRDPRPTARPSRRQGPPAPTSNQRLARPPRHLAPGHHATRSQAPSPPPGYSGAPHMISTNQFKNGNHIEVEGTVFKIIEFQHVKPGKGGAFVRTKLRRAADGAVIDRTFRAGEKFRPDPHRGAQDAVPLRRRHRRALHGRGELRADRAARDEPRRAAEVGQAQRERRHALHRRRARRTCS